MRHGGATRSLQSAALAAALAPVATLLRLAPVATLVSPGAGRPDGGFATARRG
ncbi:hypothetical protein [Geodermatophilus normandii]|uniref:hypothetical protein n=1 Tax=Geodermatophilus normandii TaxID=1137989 RepID=UPI00147304EF|nr:hypothetical protein [Geodermatophilus normandii]